MTPSNTPTTTVPTQRMDKDLTALERDILRTLGRDELEPLKIREGLKESATAGRLTIALLSLEQKGYLTSRIVQITETRGQRVYRVANG